ncbi:AraC family transcriptional regulator [Silvibacterium sp.]|uniref:AraC family transcriptional regulator n=1 Tax=Silvibacterium sp. TaxID=1964179 RepID=UPI0039E60317
MCTLNAGASGYSSQSYNRSVDPLSDVLTLLKPRAYVTGALSAGGSWSLQLPAYRGLKCYLVVTGECWLRVEGVEQPIRLREGNCLILPHGRSFVIASDLTLPPLDAREVLATVKKENGVLAISPGKEFLVLGCHFDLEGDARFLLDVLPLIVMLDQETHRESMRWTVERIQREIGDPQPGGSLIAQQAAYTLLVEALRLHLASGMGEHAGWLSALADRRMRSALSCMHEAPAHPWTLQALAHSAGMSRTAFAETFRRTVGEAPMAYLTRWRMTLAANRLRGKREPISSIAPSLGYQSESAFSAAFKRQWGCSPRQYLSEASAEPDVA